MAASNLHSTATSIFSYAPPTYALPPLPSFSPSHTHYLPAMSEPTLPSFSRPSSSTPHAPSYTLPSLLDQSTLHHPPSLSISAAAHASPVHASLAAPLPHASTWARPAAPHPRILPHVEFPPPLLARVGSAEEKLRSSGLLQELLGEVIRRTQGTVTADMNGRLVVPGRKRDENVIASFGFPRTDEDVEYCLEDTPGLSQTNFMALKSSLLDNLAQVRQAAQESVAEVETTIAQQLAFRVIPTAELERRLAYVVGRFCKTRKQIMHKYRGYVRNRRWIENVATRQRRGCLTHRQNNILRLWLFSNFSNPYPDNADKKKLIHQTQLSMTQINNWLINARSRVWKPTVETMSGERIRKEMSNKEDRYADHRNDNKTDFDAECFASPAQTQNANNAHVHHQEAMTGSHVQQVQAPVQMANGHTGHGGGGTVEGIAEDGTWLGPQAWSGLDFPADVNLTN